MNVIATLGRGRPVTEAEIAHYRDHGWVKLDRFVDQQTVAALLALAKGKMGDDADSNPVGGGGVDFLNNEWVSGIGEPTFAPLIGSIGRNAKALMGRDVGARYLMDSFVAKLPAGKEARHDTNARTDIHQDLSTWPLDRTGGMSFWLALSDAGPDNGTMEFLSGSHRMGPLGGFITHKGRDLTEVYPELATRCPSSGQRSYEAGDATVHSDLCAHGTGPNLSDDPRWAYIIGCVPEDACWNGATTSFFRTERLTQYGPLDDEDSPIISEG